MVPKGNNPPAMDEVSNGSNPKISLANAGEIQFHDAGVIS